MNTVVDPGIKFFWLFSTDVPSSRVSERKELLRKKYYVSPLYVGKK